MIYEELQPVSEAEFEAIMASGSSDDKRAAVFRAADCADDYAWLMDRFKRLLETVTDPNVLSASILGVGYIAQRFRQADERELKKMLRPFTKMANPMHYEVKQAEWDIYVYLSKQRRKRKRERRRTLQGKA